MSLNLNSPTVQAMLANTPTGVGNIPTYNGNEPTIYSDPRTNFTTPYPSPKDMIVNGQSSVYAPTAFTNNGRYNPMLNGYSNPYMGTGSYLIGQQIMSPADRDVQERAMLNMVSFEEQQEMDRQYTTILLEMSCMYCGLSEEETKEVIDDYFNPKYTKQGYQDTISIRNKKNIKIKVSLYQDDEKIREKEVSLSSPVSTYTGRSYELSSMIRNENINNTRKMNYFKYIQACVPQTHYENDDNPIDYFNNHLPEMVAFRANQTLEIQRKIMAGMIYNKEEFKRLLEIHTKSSITRNKRKAIDRFTGRYGVMPDGRPTTPGIDPSIASSFSYDPSTGQYHVTAPKFMNSLENARASFYKTIGQ